LEINVPLLKFINMHTLKINSFKFRMKKY